VNEFFLEGMTAGESHLYIAVVPALPMVGSATLSRAWTRSENRERIANGLNGLS
jgi:hypothetical protein